MRASNADVVAKEIEEYKAEVERKLKGMVAQFAYVATQAIQENIPIGDQLSIDMGENSTGPAAAYRQYYQERFDNPSLRIPMEVGFHRGALGYSESGNFQFMPIVYTADESAQELKLDVKAYYEIGDEFFIGAEGPAYDLLEGNKSSQTNGQGIAAPSERAIINIYSSDMKSFYDAA